MTLNPDCMDILENVKCIALNVDNLLLCLRLIIFLSVSLSVRYGQPSEHSFVADTRVVLFSQPTMPQQFKQFTRAIVNDLGRYRMSPV